MSDNSDLETTSVKNDGHSETSEQRRRARRDFPAGRADVHHVGLDYSALMNRDVTPVDEWRLVETSPQGLPIGLSETLFNLSNGYIGLRANPPEGRDSAEHGTFINGLHETWQIRHAEDAFGLAREGQTIVNAPDAKPMRLYIDDEPLRLSVAELEDFERSLDSVRACCTAVLSGAHPVAKKCG